MHELPILKRMAAYEPTSWALIPDLGLYMDQVLTYIEQQLEPLYGAQVKGLITGSMVNNYVKSGLLARPLGKKYYREHLATLMMIALLKQVASMDDIARLTKLADGQSPEEQYEQFRSTQSKVFRSISIDPDAGTLQCAVTATAYQLVTEAMLSDDPDSGNNE